MGLRVLVGLAVGWAVGFLVGFLVGFFRDGPKHNVRYIEIIELIPWVRLAITYKAWGESRRQRWALRGGKGGRLKNDVGKHKSTWIQVDCADTSKYGRKTYQCGVKCLKKIQVLMAHSRSQISKEVSLTQVNYYWGIPLDSQGQWLGLETVAVVCKESEFCWTTHMSVSHDQWVLWSGSKCGNILTGVRVGLRVYILHFKWTV